MTSPTPSPQPSLDQFRGKIADAAKHFKVSWVELGQQLYTVWNDQLFQKWGFPSFEQYVVKELGIKKATAMRLLKTYYFVEEQEPSYLKDGYVEQKEAPSVPPMDAINVLRLAQNKKEVTRDDYAKLRKDVFEGGKDATAVRKDLTALIKERKSIDPEEERQMRHEQSLRKMLTALKTFKKDLETLKLSSPDVLKETQDMIDILEEQLN